MPIRSRPVTAAKMFAVSFGPCGSRSTHSRLKTRRVSPSEAPPSLPPIHRTSANAHTTTRPRTSNAFFIAASERDSTARPDGLLRQRFHRVGEALGAIRLVFADVAADPAREPRRIAAVLALGLLARLAQLFRLLLCLDRVDQLGEALDDRHLEKLAHGHWRALTSPV